MSKKKEKFTAEEIAEAAPPLKFEFEFQVIHPGGKADPPFVVEAEGKSEGEAILAAKETASEGINVEDDIVQFTGKFKKL
jgi:hypothetical protein